MDIFYSMHGSLSKWLCFTLCIDFFLNEYVLQYARSFFLMDMFHIVPGLPSNWIYLILYMDFSINGYSIYVILAKWRCLQCRWPTSNLYR